MTQKHFDWAIIGAGPAGIAAVGKLIDHGVNPKKIAWIDPEFNVGDFGAKWGKVSSNTRVSLFLKYFAACQSFDYKADANSFPIHQADPNKTCLLSLAVEPLQWITETLKKKVQPHTSKVLDLRLYDRHWHNTLSDGNTIVSKNVVVATGAEPTSLNFPGALEIPLTIALDPDELKNACKPEDTIAVFGSSHSAIIILKTLVEQGCVKKIVNFYQSPLRYAVYLDDWILFDDTGLKGIAAEWARENIDGILPRNVERVLSSDENIRVLLPRCQKVIYATGFQKRLIPVEGMQTLKYNDRSGIIAPGLFGLGIAFPEARIDRYGTLEYRVGLWKFQEYLSHVLPIWLKYGS